MARERTQVVVGGFFLLIGLAGYWAGFEDASRRVPPCPKLTTATLVIDGKSEWGCSIIVPAGGRGGHR